MEPTAETLECRTTKVRAKRFAERAHAGQFRRDGKTPYIQHCAAVAKCLEDSSNWDGPTEGIGWLHDVLEDTSATVLDLARAGFPRSLIQTLIVLTKFPEESYWDYLGGIKADPVARRVKIADIFCNLTDTPTDGQKKQYLDALLFLNS